MDNSQIENPSKSRSSKPVINSHSSNEAGKSTIPDKKISSNVHWFCALHENEDDLQTRKIAPFPSMPNLPINKKEEDTENKTNDNYDKNLQSRNKIDYRSNKNNLNKKIDTLLLIPKKCMLEVVTLNLQIQKN